MFHWMVKTVRVVISMGLLLLYMEGKERESRGDENRYTGCLFVCFILRIGW